MKGDKYPSVHLGQRAPAKGTIPSGGQTVSTANQLDLLLNNKRQKKEIPELSCTSLPGLAPSFINLRSAQERQYNKLIQEKA